MKRDQHKVLCWWIEHFPDVWTAAVVTAILVCILIGKVSLH